MKKSHRLPFGYDVKRFDHLEQGIDYVEFSFPRTGGRGSRSKILTASNFFSPRILANELKDRGAVCPKNQTWDALAKSLQAAVPDKAGNATSTYGWKEAAGKVGFMLPGQAFGDLSLKFIPMNHNKDLKQPTGVSGTLEEWIQKVAIPSGKSPVVAAAVLTSLAGATFRHSDLSEPFILNLAGTSSTGKTSANTGAASIWGNPKQMCKWRRTDRSFDEVLAAHNDLCFIPDDIEKGKKTKTACFDMIEEMTHLLTSDGGMSHSSMVSNENQLPPLAYQCTTVSSSPITVERHQRETRSTDRENSHRVRLLEIEIASPDDGGIWAAWNKHPKATNPSEQSDALRLAAETNYGEPGRVWIKYLVKHHASLPRLIRMFTNGFIRRNAQNMSGVERRIALKVGLLYATAMIAKKAGVIPWSTSSVRELTAFIFQSIMAAGFPEKLEEGHVVGALCQKFQDSSLPVYRNKKSGAVNLPKDAIGFVHEPSGRAYLRSAAFESICSSCLSTRSAGLVDVERMISALKQRKFLLSGQGKYHTKVIRLANGKARFLVFQLSAFEV